LRFVRAQLKTFHRGDADLAALEGLASGDSSSETEEVFIQFALAKALEDIGDYTRAFEHLSKGNTLKRQQTHYDELQVAEYFQRISRVFNEGLFDRLRGAGNPSATPIFVLGMPCSGSTLIEQILASHPQIYAAGELASASTVLGPPLEYPESVIGLDRTALEAIGQAYLARLPVAANGKMRIVDKQPENFLNIGLIYLMLPNARIIHTTRNAIDNCMSCYSKLFQDIPYCYDLGELGRFYRRYTELMSHWQSVLTRDAVLDVSYENVVDDLEGQARRLIDYCGLSWDRQCLKFEETRRPVKTSSAVQVRRPLFRSSIGRWRKHQAALAPLLRALGHSQSQ
jgi:tetratricopeptide (TPR) repeat protein